MTPWSFYQHRTSLCRDYRNQSNRCFLLFRSPCTFPEKKWRFLDGYCPFDRRPPWRDRCTYVHEKLKRYGVRRPCYARKRSSHRSLVQRLPFKTRFRTSVLYISVIPPLLVESLAGILSAIMDNGSVIGAQVGTQLGTRLKAE